MKRNMLIINPEYVSPNELAHQLRAMAVLDIVMNPLEDSWLRLVQKDPLEEAYYVRNGAGDEMDIFFEEKDVFIRGFDHENDLNQFGADEWDESFFKDSYAGFPQKFLDLYEEEEQRYSMTFCMWYDGFHKCWKQNAVEGNDGGQDYLLSYICKNGEEWISWAESYYETKLNRSVANKVFEGKTLTWEEIQKMNPQRDGKAALEEIRENQLEIDINWKSM